MALIKNGVRVADSWLFLDKNDPLPAKGDIVLPLERWLGEKNSFTSWPGRIGLLLDAGQVADNIGTEVDRFALIALAFPKFSDGRAFSTARLLRERYAFRGELRAIGHVLPDQYLFMVRCGFDAFEVEPGTNLNAWSQALDEISVFYQPTGDGQEPTYHLRHLSPRASGVG